MIWPENTNTNMQNVMNRVTRLYQFLRSGSMFLIAISSWMCKQAIGMAFWPWNAQQLWKQIWDFCEKMQVCSWGFSAAFLCYALGYCSAYVSEWIRLTIQAQSLVFNDFEYLIFLISFSIFLSWRTCQLWKICLFWTWNELPPCLSWICCIKKI